MQLYVILPNEASKHASELWVFELTAKNSEITKYNWVHKF